MNKDWVPLGFTVSLVNHPMQQRDDREPPEAIDTIYADRGRARSLCLRSLGCHRFPNMIRRSVPGYEASLDLIAMCAQQFGRANTRFYDLGCSRGAAIAAMLRRSRQTRSSLAWTRRKTCYKLRALSYMAIFREMR